MFIGFEKCGNKDAQTTDNTEASCGNVTNTTSSGQHVEGETDAAGTANQSVPIENKNGLLRT